jgi:SulP family sulfate permease
VSSVKRLPRELIAAAITAAVSVTYALSYAALIFAGPLSPELAQGISMMLVTAAAGGIVVALTSSFRFAIAGADSNATAVLATLAATLAETLPLDPARAAHNVLLALMLGAASGGIVLVVLGQYRAGRWIRFIPYPIVAGFLAASGWLLLNGSLRVVADVSLPQHVGNAFTADGSIRLGVGVAFAAVLYATRQLRNPLLLPALLVGGSAVTDAALLIAGRFDRIHGATWLLPPIGAPHLTSIVLPAAYAGIAWHDIGDVTPAIATAIAVTVIAILFGAAGLEAQTGVDADLDRELRASGLASIASAFCGGSLASLSSSRTILNVNAGAQTRLSGVAVGAASALVLAGGAPLVALVPRPILGGLLLYLGYTLLSEWIGKAWRRLGRGDVVLVLTIVVVTGLKGFLAALAIGLLFSCVSFVIRYGRFRAIRHALSGSNKRSRVERSAAERHALDRDGGAIRILILHGYIFFGTANALLDEARAYLDGRDGTRARSLILDFAFVTGIDSSAANSFATLTALGRRTRTPVVFSSLSDDAYALLTRAEHTIVDAGERSIFIDLDHALEWAEDELLAQIAHAESESVREWMARELGGAAQADAFLAYFDPVDVAAGELLFRRGDASDALFIVTAGRLCVTNGDEAAHERRLRSMVAGSVIGEMGLFTSEPRSAGVYAEEDATLVRLSAAALGAMTAAHPQLAAAFQAMLFRLQAERLRFANAEIAALEA